MTRTAHHQARRGAPHRRGLAYRRRVGGAMLVACGVLGSTVVLLPDVQSTVPLLACSGVALAVGVLLMLRPEAAPRWSSQVMIALVTLLITLAAATTEPHASGRAASVEVFYVLVAIYAFYFFSARAGLAQVLFAGVAYGAVLWGQVSASTGLARWGTTVAGMVVAGMMVRAMNQEVDRLVGELDATAARDPLTGALNRRGLQERLGIELTRARRAREPVSLVAADLDGLKGLNDGHGHAAGDEALRLMADVVGAELRDVDVLARTGGDEFVIVLPNCDLDSGVGIAENLRVRVGEAARRESWPVTVSFGVATAPPLPLDPEGLLGAADAALYRAKSLGRNRVARAGRAELRAAIATD